MRTTRAWSAADWIALPAITMVAAGLRGFRLTLPSSMVFDEYHYAREACWYVRGAATCGFPLQHTESHPPLAKWLIGWGIETFGHTPLGWRIASVVAGVLTVVLLYLMARRILHSTVGAILASGFLAIDTLHFIHSRLAMLDVFVTLFVVAAILFCVYDREQALRHTQGTGSGRTGALFHRPWRIAAGAALGASIASKWSALPLLVAVVFLMICWEVSARQADGRWAALARTVQEEGLSFIVWLVVFPFLIYVATYIGTPPGSARAGAGLNDPWIGSVVRQQVYMLQFHAGFSVTHPSHSSFWSLLAFGRPLAYFAAVDDIGYRLILGSGNPTWLVSMLAIATFAVRAIRRRRLDSADLTILTCFVLAYGFVLVTAGARGTFLFYFLTTIPFMYLAVARLATTLTGSRSATPVTMAWVALSILYFAISYPWVTAAHVSHASWRPAPHDLSHCDRRYWMPVVERPRPC